MEELSKATLLKYAKVGGGNDEVPSGVVDPARCLADIQAARNEFATWGTGIGGGIGAFFGGFPAAGGAVIGNLAGQLVGGAYAIANSPNCEPAIPTITTGPMPWDGPQYFPGGDSGGGGGGGSGGGGGGGSGGGNSGGGSGNSGNASSTSSD